jgi:hypothetical protein
MSPSDSSTGHSRRTKHSAVTSLHAMKPNLIITKDGSRIVSPRNFNPYFVLIIIQYQRHEGFTKHTKAEKYEQTNDACADSIQN